MRGAAVSRLQWRRQQIRLVTTDESAKLVTPASPPIAGASSPATAPEKQSKQRFPLYPPVNTGNNVRVSADTDGRGPLPAGVTERSFPMEGLDRTMTHRGPRRRLLLRALVLMTSLGGILAQPTAAHAAVRQTIPEEQPGPPFYARIISNVSGTEELSAVVFYRDPACIPPDFNLLQFFDIPRAFGCRLTVEGFVIWKNGPPPIDQAPIQQQLFGTGNVPVWFVSTAELQVATSDGVLTIGELQSLPSLVIGSASSFHETLHPVQAAKRGMIEITASGTLSNGESFRLQGVCAVYEDCRNGHVRITFR